MWYSIKYKLILLLSVLLILTVVASLIATDFIVKRSQRKNLLDSIARTEQVVNTLLETQQLYLKNLSEVIGILPVLSSVVANRDESTIRHSATRYQKQLKLTIFDILDDSGDLLVSVNHNYPKDDEDDDTDDEGEIEDDTADEETEEVEEVSEEEDEDQEAPLSESDYLISQSLEEGKSLVSLVLRQDQMSLLATAPIGVPVTPSGVLMVGIYLDHAFANRIKSLTQAEISFLTSERITGSSLSEENQSLLLAQSLPKEREDVLLDIGTHLLKIKPMKDVRERIIGYLIIQFPLAESKAVLQNIRTLLAALGVGIFCVAIILGFLFTLRTIIKPITSLQTMAGKLAKGDLDQTIDISRKDEFGNLARSFAEMRDAIRMQIEDLNTLNETGAALAAIFDQKAASLKILHTIQDKTGVHQGSVYLLKENSALEITAWFPINENKVHCAKGFQLGKGVVGKSAQEKKIIYIPNTAQSTDYIDHEEGPPKTLLCIPLLDGDELFGVMNFTGEVGKTQFEQSDVYFAQTLARLTVVTLKNIQMVEVIEEQNRTLEQKVEERTTAIKDLMDNTGQGFFTFGGDYKIHPEYSKPCQVFFEGALEDLNALDLMFATPKLTAEELRQHMEQEDVDSVIEHSEPVKELFDTILGGVGDFEIFGDLLPQETTVKDRILALEYRPLKSKDGKEKIMMILTDVTTERALATQIAEEEERNAMVIKIALDRDGFIQFLRELDTLYLSLYSLLAHPASEINPNELFRYYHTIKGGCASYNLKKVVEAAHRIEAGLEDTRSGQHPLTEKEILQLLYSTTELHEIFNQTLKELSAIVPQDDRHQTERVYKISESKIGQLKNFLWDQVVRKSLERLEEEIAEITNKPIGLIKDTLLDKVAKEYQEEFDHSIEDLRKQPIGSMLQKYAMVAEGLAERLNKPLKVELKGKEIEVGYEHLETFFGTLVHLIRNCVDHGLEDPATRLMLGKPEMGTITIEAIDGKKMLKVLISDDGGGIDANVIKNIALKKGMIDQTYAESAPENELIQLILAPGFSTKEEVSDISGRGVGMDAVKAAVDELHGIIDINTELGRGTSFEICIPT